MICSQSSRVQTNEEPTPTYEIVGVDYQQRSCRRRRRGKLGLSLLIKADKGPSSVVVKPGPFTSLIPRTGNAVIYWYLETCPLSFLQSLLVTAQLRIS
jgi:hypothetical protein